jgi:hypothetical protein
MKTYVSFGAAVCALLLAMPLAAASGVSEKTGKSMTKAAAVQSVWPPETLSGKITMIDPAQRLVIIQTSDGVPFDMVVTPRTRIESGDRATAFKDLTQDINRNVSVSFIPERRGDVATSIQIGG